MSTTKRQVLFYSMMPFFPLHCHNCFCSTTTTTKNIKVGLGSLIWSTILTNTDRTSFTGLIGCGNTVNNGHLGKAWLSYSKYSHFCYWSSEGCGRELVFFLFGSSLFTITSIKSTVESERPKWRYKNSQQTQCATLMTPGPDFTAASSQLCLVCSISVSRELHGKSPRRWRWYKYSSTCKLMLRTSGSRSRSWPNLSECPGWLPWVCSIRALFTLSWVCSTCLRFCTDFTSRTQTGNNACS